MIENLPGWATAILFFLGYTLACAFPVPGTRLLAIGAGAFFTKWLAFVLVLGGACCGAFGGFLLVRYAARERFATYLANKFPRFMPLLDNNSRTLLCSLRMSPFVPFSVVHGLMALSRISVFDFMAITFLGSFFYSGVWVFSGLILSNWFHQQGDSILERWDVFAAIVVVSFLPILLKWLSGLKRSNSFLDN